MIAGHTLGISNMRSIQFVMEANFIIEAKNGKHFFQLILFSYALRNVFKIIESWYNQHEDAKAFKLVSIKFA